MDKELVGPKDDLPREILGGHSYFTTSDVSMEGVKLLPTYEYGDRKWSLGPSLEWLAKATRRWKRKKGSIYYERASNEKDGTRPTYESYSSGGFGFDCRDSFLACCFGRCSS